MSKKKEKNIKKTIHKEQHRSYLLFWNNSHLIITLLLIIGGLSYKLSMDNMKTIWELGDFFRSSWPYLAYFITLLVLSVVSIKKVSGSRKKWAYILFLVSLIICLAVEFFFRVSGGWDILSK